MNHECQKEEIITNLRKDIDSFYAVKDVVIELKALVSMLNEQYKKQDETSRKQSEMLIIMHETSSRQSDVLSKISDKYEELDSKFTQKNLDELRENSISFNSLIRMLIDKALPPLIIAGLTYFIIQITK